jgi:hypothetical protein
MNATESDACWEGESLLLVHHTSLFLNAYSEKLQQHEVQVFDAEKSTNHSNRTDSNKKQAWILLSSFYGSGLPGPQTRGGGNRLCGPRKARIDPQKLVEVYRTQSGDRIYHRAHEKRAQIGAKSSQRNVGQCNQRAAERRGDELWKVDQVGGAVLAPFLRPIKNDFSVTCSLTAAKGALFQRRLTDFLIEAIVRNSSGGSISDDNQIRLLQES